MKTNQQNNASTELLFRMYDKQLDRWNRRRSDEWKITITLWTGAFVSTGFLATKLQLELWHSSFYVFLWLMYVFVWLRGLWRANARDKAWVAVYKSHIDMALMTSIKDPVEYEEPKISEFFKDWSMIFQGTFTALILALCWYALHILHVNESFL